MTRALAVAILLTGLALAGCAAPADDDGEPSATQTSTGALITYGTTSSTSSSPTAPSNSASSTSTAPENRPPTGSISAFVNGTDAVFTITGTDPDGDEVSWDLDFGDGASTSGTSVPATVNHTYAAGNYTATLVLTDGRLQATFDVLVAVAAAGAVTQFFAGETTASSAACPQATADTFVASGIPVPQPFNPYPDGLPAEGIEWLRFEVFAGTIGMPYAWQAGGTLPVGMAASFDFYGADLAQLSTDISGAGLVPDGATFAVFYPCGPAPMTFQYSVG